MKYFLNLFCIAALFVAGCATQKQVAQMEGQGKTQVFNASYDQVWRAAVDAAQIGDLEVKTADRTNGYIAARRGMKLHTHGENVGIWVRPGQTGQTQVEVVSRLVAPKFWFKNWEDEILTAISANLTREAASPTIREPAGVESETRVETTPLAPPPPPSLP